MNKTLLLLLLLFGCSPKFIPQATTDVQPLRKGKYAHLPTEGSGIEVPIDTVTALDTFIHRLSGKFPFVETGKAYFIGYTNDQFSIAAHGEAAIPALMHYIKADADPLGKAGAIYALHLIGINSTVAGRQYEEFSSVKARNALRDLLQIEVLQDQVMELLKRDPWQSDVPLLFERLNHSQLDNWAVVNCLTRYNIRNIPYHEKIPTEIADIRLEPLLRTTIRLNQTYDDKWTEPYERQAIEMVTYLSTMKNKSILVDTTLLHSTIFGSSYFDLQPGGWSVNGKRDKPGTITLNRLFDNIMEVKYWGSNGMRIQYYMEDNRLNICSTITAKQRLLTWWNSLPMEQKNSFTQNAGPRQ